MTILWGFDENILKKLVLVGLRPIFLGPCRSGEGHPSRGVGFVVGSHAPTLPDTRLYE
jgi:hypothetical protein